MSLSITFYGIFKDYHISKELYPLDDGKVHAKVCLQAQGIRVPFGHMRCATCSSDVRLGAKPTNRAYKVAGDKAVCMPCFLNTLKSDVSEPPSMAEKFNAIWNADCFTKQYEGDDYGDVEFCMSIELLENALYLIENDPHVYDLTEVNLAYVRALTREMFVRVVRKMHEKCTATIIMSLKRACDEIRDVIPQIVTAWDKMC